MKSALVTLFLNLSATTSSMKTFWYKDTQFYQKSHVFPDDVIMH